MPDTAEPNTKNVRWNGQPAQLITADFGTVCERLPEFERQPIRWDAQDEPDAYSIMRLPQAVDALPVPVAMVTESYELIQHTEIAEALCSALEPLYSEPYRLPAWLTITEYGERIHLVVVLKGREFRPDDGYELQLTAHCFNSVDKSMALQLRLGWYRWICSNGLYLGNEVARARQVHAAGLRPIDLPWLLGEQLESAETEHARLQQWGTTAVTTVQVEKWIDETVAKQWGVTIAARAYHAAREGRDGTIEIKPATKMLAHARPFTYQRDIPGATVPLRNAYQVMQALSWVAHHNADEQDNIDRTRAIPKLLDDLLTTPTPQPN